MKVSFYKIHLTVKKVYDTIGAREGGLRGKQTRNHFEAVKEHRGNAFLASRFAEIRL